MTELRSNWVDTWMSLADRIALRSRCERRQIGAVIVSSDNAYSVVGYNGPPRGLVTPGDDRLASTVGCTSWCARSRISSSSASRPDYDNCVTIHAEANALIRSDYSRIQDGAIYVSSAPCWDCGKMIANSGVVTVYTHMDTVTDAHRLPMETIRFMRNCGLEVFVI
jgi:dCMP deaminase